MDGGGGGAVGRRVRRAGWVVEVDVAGDKDGGAKGLGAQRA